MEEQNLYNPESAEFKNLLRAFGPQAVAGFIAIRSHIHEEEIKVQTFLNGITGRSQSSFANLTPTQQYNAILDVLQTNQKKMAA